MRQTSSTRSASPWMSGRQVGTAHEQPVRLLGDAEAERGEDALLLAAADTSMPPETCHAPAAQQVAARRVGHAPGDHQFGGFAAAEIEDHARGELDAGLA